MRHELAQVAGRLVVMLASTAGFAFTSAQAQTLSVVHNFTGGSDGSNPQNGFLVGSTGALYGTASAGGASNLGLVFKLSGKSRETVLHDFTGGADGATPNGAVIENASGILFGTTTAGGTTGNGTVFRIKGKKESVLYSFAGGTDGADPQAGLVTDASGNLYGTTSAGGSAGNGSVFELIAPQGKNGAWTEKQLYSFGAGTDGATPIGGVIFDKAGNLYGTTSAGGASSYGIVFELTPGAAWTETILHSFQNGNDGATPYAGLVADAAGNMYGAATDGGVNGGGSVFELTPSGSSWSFSAIASQPGYGISGTFRDLMLDSAGNIYGSTHCDGNNGSGTIYELTPSGGSWNYSLLYTFTGGSDGRYSISNLAMKNGKLYGTTITGGANGAGVIYELAP